MYGHFDHPLDIASSFQPQTLLDNPPIPMQFVYKFEYQAEYADKGSEHELCSVFIGQFDGTPTVNATEVSAYRWVDPGQLNRELGDPDSQFTPWLRLEWQTLNDDYLSLMPKIL